MGFEPNIAAPGDASTSADTTRTPLAKRLDTSQSLTIGLESSVMSAVKDTHTSSPWEMFLTMVYSSQKESCSGDPPFD